MCYELFSLLVSDVMRRSVEEIQFNTEQIQGANYPIIMSLDRDHLSVITSVKTKLQIK